MDEKKARQQSALKAVESRAQFRKVVDGFQNAFTGAGTSRSKLSGAHYVRNDLLTCEELETLFQDHDLAYKIVAKPIEDMLRAGFILEREGGAPAEEDQEKLLAEMDRLGARQKMADGAVFGRLFGGAGLILGVRGAGPLDSPLDDTKATSVEWLLPFDRQDLTATEWDALGRATVYQWTQPTYGASPVSRAVHATRLITFEGARTTTRAKNTNQGWSLSVLQRVVDVLRSFDGAWSSVDAMFSDASQAVFKLQGLIQSIAEADGSGQQDVHTRLALMDLLRSTGKAVVLDAGDETGAGAEDFEVVDRASLGGLGPMLEQYYVRIGAAAEMPLTVLLGVSPSGKDATGESDLTLYYNRVDVERSRSVHPNLLRLLRLLAVTLKITEPEKLKIKWPGLYTPTPQDVATIEKMAVDSAVALVTNDILLPEEVALSLKSMVPNLKINIDPAPRREALTMALEELAAREMTGTKPAVEEGPDNTPPKSMTSRSVPADARGKQ